jgi:hypothetical protein
MNDESIIEAIYSSITQDDMFPIVLELLARRFRCVGAALIYVDPGRPAAAIAAGHGPTGRPEVQDLYRREYARDDPAPAAFARLRVGDTLSRTTCSISGSRSLLASSSSSIIRLDCARR